MARNVRSLSHFRLRNHAQQTQVSRVEEKYKQFVAAFSDFTALDNAPLSRVYAVWQGLGYNRRALSLKKAAQVVAFEHHGVLPHTEEALMALPGIGKATASRSWLCIQPSRGFYRDQYQDRIHPLLFKKKSLVSDEELFTVRKMSL